MKAVIFPGQGAQYPGMGKDLYDKFPKIRELFSTIDSVSQLKISQACLDGSKEDLRKPLLQQLGILATCLAAHAAFLTKNIPVNFLSGLSLGEYFCLYPAGVLDIPDLVRVIKARALATEEALADCPSLMLAIIGLDRDRLRQLCAKEGFYLANLNTPRQAVISLKVKDRQRIRALLEGIGAKVIELEVEGGFHSPLMNVAKKQLAPAISDIVFKPAKIPIVSNVTALASTDSSQIKNNLIEQLTSPALWQDCLELMIKQGVDLFFELGPSRTLRGMIRKINPKVKVINIENSQDLDSLS